MSWAKEHHLLLCVCVHAKSSNHVFNATESGREGRRPDLITYIMGFVWRK